MRLYEELAEWWPLLDDPETAYAVEAGIYADLLAEACDGPIESLLELGSGGGNNALHMKQRFPHLLLTDISEAMLAVSRALNPECEHRLGDMRTLRLDRTFDAVFVHDAVCYMTTEADLRRALETAWVHCRPGGAVLFAPDYVRENFPDEMTDDGGCDESATSGAAGTHPRGLRYLEWQWDPDPSDTQYVVDYAFLVRDRDGSARAVYDRHVEGLFTRQCWLDLLDEVGFDARTVPFVHPEVEPGRHEMFVGRRRASPTVP
ncbi:MAG: class I SAM-dependent methyltransferase [Acidobacteria bacterium]|nr:class I SAM-dependent methyltransferase [Acidobacteriota bacterium]